MKNALGKLVGWAMPLDPAFDTVAVARRLGHDIEHDPCPVFRQGRCPGKEHCADCHWGEGRLRQSRQAYRGGSTGLGRKSAFLKR